MTTSRTRNVVLTDFLATLATRVLSPNFTELNPLERVWSQSKRYTSAYCDYTIGSLHRSIPLGLKSVSVIQIRTYPSRVLHFSAFHVLRSIVFVVSELKLLQWAAFSLRPGTAHTVILYNVIPSLCGPNTIGLITRT